MRTPAHGLNDPMAFVYMLKCSDGSSYVGSTRASLEAHGNDQNGGRYGGFTATRRPVALVWTQEFQRITDATEMERRVEGWRRAKKEALISGNLQALPELASRRRQATATKGDVDA
jgi:putative endonuclease